MTKSGGKKRKGGGGANQSNKNKRSHANQKHHVPNQSNPHANTGNTGSTGRNVNQAKSSGTNHVKASSTNQGAHLAKLSLPRSFESTDNEIPTYYDYHHKDLSVSPSSKHLKGNSSKAPQRGGYGSEVSFKSEMMSSSVEHSPELRSLEKGFDLEKDLKPWCCFGRDKWNGRQFAHELSSHFSSPLIGSEGDMLGKVDFISDWANIKTLIKSNQSNSHLSYLIHRIGNSVTVDHLDLSGLMLFPNFLEISEGFRKFIIDVVGENAEKIKNDGKSNKEVLEKETYHQLLHRSMKTEMIINRNIGSKVHTSATDSVNDIRFLHHMMLSTDKLKMLVGCDVPTFIQKGASSSEEKVTVQTGSNMDRPCGVLDIWLDNVLMQCARTQMVNLKNSEVTKTEWIKTDDLPRLGKFDASHIQQHAENVFNFIQESVKTSNTYWLYRAPGSFEMKLYNVSNISLRNDETSQTSHIFENWSLLSPFVPYFNVASLMKYAEFVSEVIPEKLKPDHALLSLSGAINDKHASKVNESKSQKFGQKLENHVQFLESRLKSNGCKWAIRNIDQIEVTKFPVILSCIQGIYDKAKQLAPTFETQLRRHGIERFLLMCLKLKRFLWEKGFCKKSIEKWKETDRLKKWAQDMITGITEILACLKVWHEEVAVDQLDEVGKKEWMYLGLCVHVVHADMLSLLYYLEFETVNKSLCRRLDQDLPTAGELVLAVELLESSLKLIPEDVIDLKMKHMLLQTCVMDKLESSKLSKTRIHNELCQRISVTLFRLISHQMDFPSYLSQDFKAGTSNGDNEHLVAISLNSSPSDFVASQTVIREYYKDMETLLDKCIMFAEQVDDEATGTEFQEMQPLVRANGLKATVNETIFTLNNTEDIDDQGVTIKHTSSFSETDFMLKSTTEDIFRDTNRSFILYPLTFPFKNQFTSLNSSNQYESENEKVLAAATKCFGQLWKNTNLENVIDIQTIGKQKDCDQNCMLY